MNERSATYREAARRLRVIWDIAAASGATPLPISADEATRQIADLLDKWAREEDAQDNSAQ